MKLRLASSLFLLGATIFFTSCKKDKNVYADDFTVTIAENPDDNAELGTIIATTKRVILLILYYQKVFQAL